MLTHHLNCTLPPIFPSLWCPGTTSSSEAFLMQAVVCSSFPLVRHFPYFMVTRNRIAVTVTGCKLRNQVAWLLSAYSLFMLLLHVDSTPSHWQTFFFQLEYTVWPWIWICSVTQKIVYYKTRDLPVITQKQMEKKRPECVTQTLPNCFNVHNGSFNVIKWKLFLNIPWTPNGREGASTSVADRLVFVIYFCQHGNLFKRSAC